LTTENIFAFGVQQKRILETHLGYGTAKSLSHYIRTRQLKSLLPFPTTKKLAVGDTYVKHRPYCQEIEAALANPTPETKQEVLRLLIDHVVVEDDAITIKHIIPTDDDCRLLPNRTSGNFQR
jgi:hypothetical protein